MKFAAAPFVLELAPRPRALADMRCEATPCNPCCQAGGSPVHIYAVLIDRCRWPHKMWLHRTASCPTQPRCCSATRFQPYCVATPSTAAAVTETLVSGGPRQCRPSCTPSVGAAGAVLRRQAPGPSDKFCLSSKSTTDNTSPGQLEPAEEWKPGERHSSVSPHQLLPSKRKPSYKTGSCEQSYAIACLLSNVAPPKHSLPSKL